MSICVITPWYGNTANLIEAYAKVVAEAERVVAIDNNTPDATGEALAAFAATHQNVILQRYATNTGFAGGNNLGMYYAHDDDIVVFLNSDVALPESGDLMASIAHDVRDGAIYGPSLQAQLVAGRWTPYLEGWCVAATKRTWRKLVDAPNVGPWDAMGYPGPYWEDNDLCLRALQRQINLVQTNWPIIHLGGRSTGILGRWAASFEQNRQTFAQRAFSILPRPQDISSIEMRYRQHLQQQSDIQHHLPLLRSLARGVVVECGTRSGVSTAALLAGVDENGELLISIDIDDCSHLFKEHPRWSFLQGSSINPETLYVLRSEVKVPIDLLLLDTLHTYDHVYAELVLWAPEMALGGTILVHDTETFPGVRRAVEEFCAENQMPVTFVLPNNGMAVIEVRRA